MRQQEKKKEDKAERVTGLGRKTREEIVKWNQMTALRFQTGGRHQTSPASFEIRRTRSSEAQVSLDCSLYGPETNYYKALGWLTMRRVDSLL